MRLGKRVLRDGQFFTESDPKTAQVEEPTPKPETETVQVNVSYQDVLAVLRWDIQSRRTSLISRLFKKQKSLCIECNEPIEDGDERHIHHIKPVSFWARSVFSGELSFRDAKRKCNELDNLQLMHKICHQRKEGIMLGGFEPIPSHQFVQKDGFIFRVS